MRRRRQRGGAPQPPRSSPRRRPAPALIARANAAANTLINTRNVTPAAVACADRALVALGAPTDSWDAGSPVDLHAAVAYMALAADLAVARCAD
eukprot:gene41544-48564_t